MSLWVEALKGAKIQLDNTPGVFNKVWTAGTLATVISSEIYKSLGSVPYGARAIHLYRSLPHPSSSKKSCVHLVKNVKYEKKDRTILDIYTPPAVQTENLGSCPVALFCHGGVWASGDPWNYAPMAATLAEAGVVTCVMTHTLYPKALVPEMLEDVSSALNWVFANISKHGGSPDKVALIGHSSGAHLCMMTLLDRAKSLSKGKVNTELMMPKRHSGIPKKFIGICGAYAIAQHFEYEKGRNVHGLSSMERAMGGKDKFDQLSPPVIIDGIINGEGGDYTKKCLKYLPSIALQTSEADSTCPSIQSEQMAGILRKAGVKAELSVDKDIGHAECVIDWPTQTPREVVVGGRTSEVRRVDFKALGGFQSSLLKMLKEEI